MSENQGLTDYLKHRNDNLCMTFLSLVGMVLIAYAIFMYRGCEEYKIAHKHPIPSDSQSKD